MKFFLKILPNQHAIAKMCRALKIMLDNPGCNLSEKKNGDGRGSKWCQEEAPRRESESCWVGR